jgi:hypothetical protein
MAPSGSGVGGSYVRVLGAKHYSDVKRARGGCMGDVIP